MSSNSVFINYRRSASSYLAQLVWRELTDAGIDAFYDISSLDAGQFDQIILNQIAARPYFMPILSPGTLERCKDPGDWVLREMQEALRLKRVIVPLVTEEFSFADFDKYLPADLASELKRYNAMPVPPRFFKYAIMEVRERFLKPIDIPIAPTPKTDAPIIAQKQAAAAAQPEVTASQLSAQEYYERGLQKQKTGDYDGAIDDYSEAIRLNHLHIEAFNNRAAMFIHKDELDNAIVDLTQAIALNPLNGMFYHNRSIAHQLRRKLDDAIADSTLSIALDPQDADYYKRRGGLHRDKGDLAAAIDDYTMAIRLNPEDHIALLERGIIYQDIGDIENAHADFRRADVIFGSDPLA